MKYLTYAPPKELQAYVRYFWSFESPQSKGYELCIKSFADKYPRLIFQNLNGFESLRYRNGDKLPVCYLSGIDTRTSEAWMDSAFSHFGASFYPHALTAFFEIESNTLVNTIPDIRLICNQPIQQQLEYARSHHERVTILSKYLFNKLNASRANDLLINHLIHTTKFDSMDNLVAKRDFYNISERQLQRRFKNNVGISIKKFQRILRFEKALQLLAKATYKDLTAIAHQLEYTDQSHFIHEFVEFARVTPYDFIRANSLGSDSSSFIYKSDV